MPRRNGKLELRIPTFSWKQIGGDMHPGAHGGLIAEADGDHIELISIQPVRDFVGDSEAKDVGHPFWSKEAWFDLEDLDPDGPNAKEVLSALQSVGMRIERGELVADAGDVIAVGPEDRAIAIADALVQYGRGDEGPAGWAKDVIGDRKIKWWGSKEPEGYEYIADEDDEFRREVLGEEDDGENEGLEENGRMAEYRPPDRSGVSVEQFGVGAQESDYFFEYGSGHSPKLYEVTRGGKLVGLPPSVQHLVKDGHIGKAIEKAAADLGQHAGVVFEIRNGEARQVGNVEGNRHGAKITWMRGVRVPNMRQTKMPFMRGKIDSDLKKRYEFFKSFGGTGHVGHAAETSLLLARAERLAEERGWEASWRDEEEDWNSFLGDFEKIEEIDTVEYCVLKDDHDNVIGSLGGISFAKKTPHGESTNYRRYVEAELALEAAHEKDLL